MANSTEFSVNSTLGCSTATRFSWKILECLNEGWVSSVFLLTSVSPPRVYFSNFPLLYLQWMNQWMNRHMWANKHKDKNFTYNEWINIQDRKRTNKYIKDLLKTAFFISLKKSLSEWFFAAICWRMLTWCSFSTMAIDRTAKHDRQWWDAIPVPITTLNFGSEWCSLFCCVNSGQAWVEIYWILLLATSVINTR